MIDNDCKVAAVGEYYSGLWEETKHLVLIEIGHGIGGAVIVDGKLYSGRHNNVGEIGRHSGHFSSDCCELDQTLC
ncbi:ROK family protein [Vibrio sp. S9_S30]|uniref:ROK family protein n=1 Tax=Vibrio sp. S9_S30 TaxID=2720226 RepID=UPI001EEE9514|nr:ROK family protein [Vibrio sp. S9_S30]